MYKMDCHACSTSKLGAYQSSLIKCPSHQPIYKSRENVSSATSKESGISRCPGACVSEQALSVEHLQQQPPLPAVDWGTIVKFMNSYWTWIVRGAENAPTEILFWSESFHKLKGLTIFLHRIHVNWFVCNRPPDSHGVRARRMLDNSKVPPMSIRDRCKKNHRFQCQHQPETSSMLSSLQVPTRSRSPTMGRMWLIWCLPRKDKKTGIWNNTRTVKLR